MEIFGGFVHFQANFCFHFGLVPFEAHFVENPELSQALSCRHEVGQNIVKHDLPAAMNSSL